jgi:peptidoglycan/LPS O-acetylase OafA/YrhL
LESNQQQKLNGLDHLRTLAICYVFLFHYYGLSKGKPEWLPGFAKFGWTGVDLFFVLSGFLIASQLFEQIKLGLRISFKQFFLKRFFRIIPAYLATVILYFCFPLFREKESLPQIWKFLTFTQNISLNLKDNGTFSHAWSLCVEEHFYLLLPITLFCLQSTGLFKRSYWLLISIFLFGFVIRIYSYNQLYLPKIDDANDWMYWYQYIYYPTYTRLDGLLVGVSIAAMYQFLPTIWNHISKYGNQLLVLSLAILTGAYFICNEQMTFSASVLGFPIIAIGYGILVAGAISKSCFLYQWNSKISSFIAGISYSVYLTHKAVIHLSQLVLGEFNLKNDIVLLICILTSICFANLLHRIIEKPFMHLRTKIVLPILQANPR